MFETTEQAHLSTTDCNDPQQDEIKHTYKGARTEATSVALKIIGTLQESGFDLDCEDPRSMRMIHDLILDISRLIERQFRTNCFSYSSEMTAKELWGKVNPS